MSAQNSSTLPPIGGAQDVFYSNSNIVPLPLIERAEGIYMWDEDGNEYMLGGGYLCEAR